jgi:hypothetical protein
LEATTRAGGRWRGSVAAGGRRREWRAAAQV